MRILLLGATGALGSRCVPALLSHSHTITAFVRDENKLRSLLPASVWSQLKVENGSATDVRSLARVIRTHEIEAVVSAAGSAPLFGSGGELPAIDHAIIAAVRESGIKMKRLWMVGGWLLLDLPGSAGTWTIYDYLPLYRDHIPVLQALRGVSVDEIPWSLICPAKMEPLSTTIPTVEEHASMQESRQPLLAAANAPPGWKKASLAAIPGLGSYLDIVSNAFRYAVKLEDVAEYMAQELARPSEDVLGKRVGVLGTFE